MTFDNSNIVSSYTDGGELYFENGTQYIGSYHYDNTDNSFYTKKYKTSDNVKLFRMSELNKDVAPDVMAFSIQDAIDDVYSLKYKVFRKVRSGITENIIGVYKDKPVEVEGQSENLYTDKQLKSAIKNITKRNKKGLNVVAFKAYVEEDSEVTEDDLENVYYKIKPSKWLFSDSDLASLIDTSFSFYATQDTRPVEGIFEPGSFLRVATNKLKKKEQYTYYFVDKGNDIYQLPNYKTLLVMLKERNLSCDSVYIIEEEEFFNFNLLGQYSDLSEQWYSSLPLELGCEDISVNFDGVLGTTKEIASNIAANIPKPPKVLRGADGKDGKDGKDGPAGPAGPPGPEGPAAGGGGGGGASEPETPQPEDSSGGGGGGDTPPPETPSTTEQPPEAPPVELEPVRACIVFDKLRSKSRNDFMSSLRFDSVGLPFDIMQSSLPEREQYYFLGYTSDPDERNVLVTYYSFNPLYGISYFYEYQSSDRSLGGRGEVGSLINSNIQDDNNTYTPEAGYKFYKTPYVISYNGKSYDEVYMEYSDIRGVPRVIMCGTTQPVQDDTTTFQPSNQVVCSTLLNNFLAARDSENFDLASSIRRQMLENGCDDPITRTPPANPQGGVNITPTVPNPTPPATPPTVDVSAGGSVSLDSKGNVVLSTEGQADVFLGNIGTASGSFYLDSNGNVIWQAGAGAVYNLGEYASIGGGISLDSNGNLIWDAGLGYSIPIGDLGSVSGGLSVSSDGGLLLDIGAGFSVPIGNVGTVDGVILADSDGNLTIDAGFGFPIPIGNASSIAGNLSVNSTGDVVWGLAGGVGIPITNVGSAGFDISTDSNGNLIWGLGGNVNVPLGELGSLQGAVTLDSAGNLIWDIGGGIDINLGDSRTLSVGFDLNGLLGGILGEGGVGGFIRNLVGGNNIALPEEDSSQISQEGPTQISTDGRNINIGTINISSNISEDLADKIKEQASDFGTIIDKLDSQSSGSLGNSDGNTTDFTDRFTR